LLSSLVLLLVVLFFNIIARIVLARVGKGIE